ncbi:MAG: segregation/condensation protein A [Candidatus Omnitrophica bacterium]|nr:segregation/condensation protein A [Candidatus Omnitrophota bacterium]
MSYKIRLEIFEGPLDLLLYLVKKNHINIYDIPIAQITEQYLAYLDLMKLFDLNIAGEFLVMASTLMQIKSRMLLPQPETESQEPEDPRQELVNRLLEYERFKEAAQQLKQKEIQQKSIFKRQSLNFKEEFVEEEIYFEANIFDLLSALSEVLKEVPKELFYEVIKDEFTVGEKIHEILHLLLESSQVKLSELFGKAKNKLEIIVIFLAILELIRMREIVAYQKELFGEILITRNQNNITGYA